MRLAPIVARLQDACPLLRAVQPALSGALPGAYPAAYVLQLAEAVAESDMGQAALVFTARFGVEISVKHAASAATGGAAQVDLEALRESVIAALVGFVPAAQYGPIAYAGGKLVDFDAGFATWREEFTVLFTR